MESLVTTRMMFMQNGMLLREIDTHPFRRSNNGLSIRICTVSQNACQILILIKGILTTSS